MNNEELHSELPENYDELKKAANRTSDWRARLEAVEELGKLNHQQAIGVLKGILKNDPVLKVQEAAQRQLKGLGENVAIPKREPGDLVPGITKLLLRIKKSLPKEHSYEEFKEKLKKMRIDVYDVYEGNKGDEFDAWLEEKWASLRTSKYS
ncbi:HEAT repeat domain-containing protein [Paenibacillus sp. YPG26]|uniref:HEAT repeat domain-containing protein n=1 Tax=Paenibacillus sp. YPG26 TaxID=2878915 RepID=UPI00203C2FC4|nr:HEAT repeat domain-containing protein [Paenibacillus sp. YPG26]USB33952.1 HEAT repeat domain-containing protein [Paenibacillus sp. YPG26]